MHGTRRSSIAGIAVAAALTLTLGACGGSSSPKSSPATTTPAKAGNVLLSSVQTTTATKSAHVSLTVATSGSSDVVIKAEGDEDFATGDSQLKMDLGGMVSRFLPDGLEVRSVDHVAYIKLPGALSGLLGGGGSSEGKWLSIDGSKLAGKANPFSNVGQSDPTKFLAYLETVSDDVKTVGTETVNGVETTHYHATLDLGKELDQSKIPPALRDKVKGLLQKGGAPAPTIPVDVYVDGDGHIVRMQMVMDTASFAGAGASGASGSLPTVTVTLNLSNFGEPVHVEAPPADQIIDLKQFGQNGGGLFGGGLGGGLGLPGNAPATKGA